MKIRAVLETQELMPSPSFSAYKKNQEKQQQPDSQEVTHSLQTTSTSVTC